MAEPEAGGGDLDEAETAGGGPVVSGRQWVGGFEAVDAPLDPVVQGVDEAVDRDRGLNPAGIPGGPNI